MCRKSNPKMMPQCPGLDQIEGKLVLVEAFMLDDFPQIPEGNTCIVLQGMNS